MEPEKRDFCDVVEELMDAGHQVAVPVNNDDQMEEIRRNMRNFLNRKKEESNIRKG
ncbi:hypothetical protein [Paenibacillus sp. RC67]|uniref:hypothetical protein n=1 Tax=Paenibacillus sp. RC67 TaxID=3039392 RepID=UPI0024AD6ACD|nr:hypothetical protein [Paenibacillus sp. RC67]